MLGHIRRGSKIREDLGNIETGMIRQGLHVKNQRVSPSPCSQPVEGNAECRTGEVARAGLGSELPCELYNSSFLGPALTLSEL